MRRAIQGLMRRLANGFARAWKASPGGWIFVGIILFFVVWAIADAPARRRERAEFDRTHECHFEMKQKTVWVNWLTGWLDERQSDPVVGPPPKYTKIGDRYYGVQTERIEVCTVKEDPAVAARAAAEWAEEMAKQNRAAEAAAKGRAAAEQAAEQARIAAEPKRGDRVWVPSDSLEALESGDWRSSEHPRVYGTIVDVQGNRYAVKWDGGRLGNGSISWLNGYQLNFEKKKPVKP